MSIHWLDWPAPPAVKACYTLRSGGHGSPKHSSSGYSCSGYSSSPYDTFNLGAHVGDNPDQVIANRGLLTQLTDQQQIVWLNQIHSTDVVTLSSQPEIIYDADASVTRQPNIACCVMTADCLPAFFCDNNGEQVAMAHAGWRGLLDGVLQNTLSHFDDPSNVLVYLGPAISQQAFEVGEEVRSAFLAKYSGLEEYFIPSINESKWMADLYQIARHLMCAEGVMHFYGGDRCTYTETADFFSYRRDGVTGRMANLIWIKQ